MIRTEIPSFRGGLVPDVSVSVPHMLREAVDPSPGDPPSPDGSPYSISCLLERELARTGRRRFDAPRQLAIDLTMIVAWSILNGQGGRFKLLLRDIFAQDSLLLRKFNFA